MTVNQPNPGNRIVSMLIDHFTMGFVSMIFFVPMIVSAIPFAFEVHHDQSQPIIFGGAFYFGLIGFALYFCKDCLGGRSIGKRALKLQVLDYRTGKIASPIKCFVRNIFYVIWPIEVLVTLINPSRRIGDLVAGTKVVEFDPGLEQPKMDIAQIGLSIILGYATILLFILPIQIMFNGMESQKVNFIEPSINKEAMYDTEQLFLDSLGHLLKPDILVYDGIEGYDSLKYISMILYLRENYLAPEEDYQYIDSISTSLLTSVFPKGSFIGQIKYVYKETGSMSTRIQRINWPEKK